MIENKAERCFYIDNLRIFAIFLMFIYHVNMIFVSEWGWHIKDDSQSNVLMEVNYWMAFFRMPLLFFVSGFISCILLEKLSDLNFTIQRFNRLIIPTAIWTFVLVAPQIYFERKLQGEDFNYIGFYKTFLEFEPYPNGNFHWLHLWFIPYLFVYNLISIPIFRSIQKYHDKTKGKIPPKTAAIFICLFVLIAIVPYTFLRIYYPATHDLIHDYARHAQFMPFVIAGLLAYKYPVILNFIEQKRALIFRLAFLSIVIINIVRWNGIEPKNVWDDWLNQPISYVFILLLGINSWLWVLTLLGYAKKYLNIGNQVLTYCNQAVYPLYILHQTVIVVVGYYVVQTSDDVVFKYLFLLIACFFICVSTYHLYIRPFKFVRVLFGSK